MHKKSAVLEFVEKERAKGTSDQDIQHKLLDAGWHMDIIHQVMETNTAQPTGPVANGVKPDNLTVRTLAKKYPIPLAVGGGFLVLVLIALFI